MLFKFESLQNQDEVSFYKAIRKIRKLNLNASNILKKGTNRGGYVYAFDLSVYGSKQEVIVKENTIINIANLTTINQELVDYMILAILAIRYESPLLYNEFIETYLTKNAHLENKINLDDVLNKVLDTNYNYSAKLRPIIDFFKLEVSFRLVLAKEYVIADLNRFILLVLEKQTQTYGKNTLFNHNLNNFDLPSKELFKLICDNQINIKEDKKTITLNSLMIDKLFSLFQGEVLKDFNNEAYYCLLKEIDIKIKLIDNKLLLENSHKIIKGYDFLYQVENKVIYKVKVTNKPELKILYNYLADKNLDLDYVEQEFVNGIYYQVADDIQIDEKFKQKYPPINFKINSYFGLENANIVLTYKILLNHEEVNSNDHIVKNNTYLTKRFYQYQEQVLFIGLNKVNLNEYRTNNLEIIMNFNSINLFNIKQFGDVYISEELKNKKIQKLPKININVEYKVDLLTFKIVNTDLTLAQIKNIINGYKKKQKFIKVKDDFIIESDKDVSDFVNIINDFSLNIDNLLSEEQKPYSHILKLLNEKNDIFLLDQKLEDILYDLKNYQNADFSLPQRFDNVLRPYQKEAFLWMKTLMKYNFGGILADEMGLGKSLEVISVISSDEVLKPSIVVCPTSLIYNWTNEINKWDPSIKVTALAGNQINRKNIIDNINSNEKEIYITSYDTLKKDIDMYNDVDFRLIIADEAQFIKNRHTLKSDAIKKLKSDIRLSLTGTPIENSLADLWSIFDFIMPGYLSSYNNFKERYETLIMNKDDDALNQLLLRIMPFILRRTKKEVLKELPDKFETIYHVNLNDQQQKLYDAYYLEALKDIDNKDHMSILTLLMRLRQICVEPSLFLDGYKHGSAKIELVLELLNRFVLSGHKVLLFSQFPLIFEQLEKRLTKQNIKTFTLTGKTKADERISLVNEFNNLPTFAVFLISLKAGGTGLNLTSADTVIHLDPWWNLSVENQASDRAHRIGQTNKVQVVKLVCANTIEQKVVELQNLKQDLVNNIINNKKSLENLSKDDIKYIFSK